MREEITVAMEELMKSKAKASIFSMSEGNDDDDNDDWEYMDRNLTTNLDSNPRQRPQPSLVCHRRLASLPLG